MKTIVTILAVVGGFELAAFALDVGFGVWLVQTGQPLPQCPSFHVAYVYALFAK